MRIYLVSTINVNLPNLSLTGTFVSESKAREVFDSHIKRLVLSITEHGGTNVRVATNHLLEPDTIRPSAARGGFSVCLIRKEITWQEIRNPTEYPSESDKRRLVVFLLEALLEGSALEALGEQA